MTNRIPTSQMNSPDQKAEIKSMSQYIKYFANILACKDEGPKNHATFRH